MSKVEQLSLKQTVKQMEGNIVSDMNGEKVMLSVKNGKYYNLGSLGGEIWDQIKEPVVIEDLISLLLEKYEVEPEQCEEQTMTFLRQLIDEGLVEAK
ncbi:lasso peptide biosynthesis PqqD family chaperone [Gracilibacillus oryzae]|uniref:Lasso peptide biosynthesis PqqD family chaperone n=1 Tax=Gracilibacillus oryzae TaxID=1672701 RepID=A0A7C8GSW4_9BACI|nr:lasso peptide biosynthesis PqqD family chaperone [Gracilibacillus oryzae]KAB8133656.1 lasso peptide biosynthesis PqqD family chaperone [Gracilibacillus oryzae]